MPRIARVFGVSNPTIFHRCIAQRFSLRYYNRDSIDEHFYHMRFTPRKISMRQITCLDYRIARGKNKKATEWPLDILVKRVYTARSCS